MIKIRQSILTSLAILGAFFLGTTPSFAVKVHVESSGQGNFIWMSHGPQGAEEVIFVDGGSSEYATTVRRAAHIPPNGKDFLLSNKPSKDIGPTFLRVRLQKIEEDHGDSSSMASGETIQGTQEGGSAAAAPLHATSDSSHTKRNAGQKRRAEADPEGGPPQKAPHLQASSVASSSRGYKLNYRENLFDRIFEQLPEIEGITTPGRKIKQVKTILITHPDDDHYNWFRFLFEPEIGAKRSNFCIQDLILSGFYEDYGEDFQKWVEACEQSNRIQRVTCTGMADGSKSTRDSVRQKWLESIPQKRGVGSSSVQTESLFARPYCSKMSEESPAESIITNALKWKEQGAPEIQILAMNAGHSFGSPTRHDLICPVNLESNVNSIVLRVVGAESSILLTGDAEESTWTGFCLL